MKQSRWKKIAGFGLVVLAVFVMGLTAGLRPAPAPVLAQDGAATSVQRYIRVVGEGSVRIKPDVAKTTIGVETVKPGVKEASEENAMILDQVLSALQAAGIAENDVQTAGFNIYAEPYTLPESNPLDAPLVRYHVINQVQVTIRDIDRVGDILDAAIEAGANSTYGVEFHLEDRDEARSQARAAAVANAAARADELAQLNDVTVGPVLSISEVIGSEAYLGAGAMQGAPFLGGGGGGTSIAAGELEVAVQIQVTYALE